jgi:LytS/YehU family sensor histidine kinase
VIGFLTKTKPRIVWVSVGILSTLLLISSGYIQWLKLGMRLNTYPEAEASMINTNYLTRTVIYQLFAVAYFAVFKLLFRYAKLKNRNYQLQLAQKTSELNFLKSQTNPHFLFNTLNGIYSLARDKSDLTADSVMRLSDILRYMLYETQTDLISIEKEIEIIEEYIELEKLRYDENLTINFKKEIDDITQKIPPLLLIHLVENAFKHGVAETIDSPCISLYLSIQNKKLLFRIENSISNHATFENDKESIGLTNLRRQLGLLFTEHQLTTTKTTYAFTANLCINLSSYVQN